MIPARFNVPGNVLGIYIALRYEETAATIMLSASTDSAQYIICNVGHFALDPTARPR
jgi:hypothetical protein